MVVKQRNSNEIYKKQKNTVSSQQDEFHQSKCYLIIFFPKHAQSDGVIGHAVFAVVSEEL